jgi:hypothetical protein
MQLMAKRYVNYNADGTIIGFMSDSVNTNIPSDALKISDEQWQDCLNNQGLRKVDVATKTIITCIPTPSNNGLIKQQIVALEATVTSRRIREAALGTDGGWLRNLDSQIAALRAQLK